MKKLVIYLFLGIGFCLGCLNKAGIASDLPSQYKAEILANFREANEFRENICLNGVWKINIQQKPIEASPDDDFLSVIDITL